MDLVEDPCLKSARGTSANEPPLFVHFGVGGTETIMNRYRNLDLGGGYFFLLAEFVTLRQTIVASSSPNGNYYSITIILMESESINYKAHGSECCNITPNEGKG